MARYKVTFFKCLLSSDGHPFKAPQEVIVVRAASVEEAEKRARSRFASLRRIAHWNLHADFAEVVPAMPKRSSFGAQTSQRNNQGGTICDSALSGDVRATEISASDSRKRSDPS
jgi:hypothetical protein